MSQNKTPPIPRAIARARPRFTWPPEPPVSDLEREEGDRALGLQPRRRSSDFDRSRVLAFAAGCVIGVGAMAIVWLLP